MIGDEQIPEVLGNLPQDIAQQDRLAPPAVGQLDSHKSGEREHAVPFVKQLPQAY